MRILAATPYYEPEGGGLERYAHGILSRLAARGHDVQAVSFTAQGAAEETMDGVRVRRLRPMFRAGNTPIDVGFASRFRQVLRKARPDVVVVHTPVPFPAQAAAMTAHDEEVPYVVTYHSGMLRGSSPLLDAVATADRWTFERRMLDRAAALIAVGPYVRDHALQRHRDRTSIVAPGVDATRFSPPAGRGQDHPPTVLFVGPLSHSYRWKGVDVLWEAFQQVHERLPTARLRLVGDGDRSREFQEKARSFPEGTVELLGRVDDAGLPSVYQQASVVALPSTSDAESFGMVLAEANACGRPVVASRIGGIPDFVQDGDNGRLAHANDAFDLAEKLLMVLEDPDEARRMGERGRTRVLRDHDWDRLAVQTESILADAAGKKTAWDASSAPEPQKRSWLSFG